MNHVEIRRPRIEDIEELSQFFNIVVKDTFATEGLAYMVDDIENEVEAKKMCLKSDLDSGGVNRYFLLALEDGKTIGSIEYGPSSELIDSLTNGAFKHLVEIGTVFVHPDYQRRGVGNLLLNVMYITLLSRGIEEFCLDSGYTNAQKIWKKKFGEPDYVFKSYWSEGNDHMIWRRSITELIVKFPI